MIVTVLEAHVPPGQELALQAAYQAGAETLPAGLIHTELLRDSHDAGRWRIQTWWTSREVLEEMRRAGTPAGVLMFRAAGAEPALSVFEVVSSLPHDAP